MEGKVVKLHRDAFTHKHFHRRVYTQKLLHTEAFTHRHFYTQTLLHTGAFTRRCFYTQMLLHTDTFTHKRFCTQTLLYTDAFTHRGFYTQTLLHTDAFTHIRSLRYKISSVPSCRGWPQLQTNVGKHSRNGNATKCKSTQTKAPYHGIQKNLELRARMLWMIPQ